MGAYIVPNLPGWHKKYTRRLPRKLTRTVRGAVKVYQIPLHEEVVYEKTVSGATIRLSLWAAPAGRSVTRADIAANLRATDTVVNTFAPSLKARETTTAWKEVALGSLPTYERTSSLTDIKGSPVEYRERQFGRAAVLYMQDLMVRGTAGAAISPLARNEAGRVWQTFSSGLHAKRGRTTSPDTSVKRKSRP